MSLQEFAELSQDTQILYLLENGVCIADRVTKTEQVFLYQVEEFYVEVCQDQRTAHIVNLNIFASTETLTPYLNRIDISELKIL